MIKERKYKYITIKQSGDLPLYRVYNNSQVMISIARIEYDLKWREWVFIPFVAAKFSFDCIVDIGDFLDILNKDY